MKGEGICSESGSEKSSVWPQPGSRTLTCQSYLSSVVFYLLLVITTLTALLKHWSSEKWPFPWQGVGQDDPWRSLPTLFHSVIQFYTKGKEKRCEDGDFKGEAKGAALGDISGHWQPREISTPFSVFSCLWANSPWQLQNIAHTSSGRLLR